MTAAGRSRLWKLLLVAGSSLLALLLAEGGLRAYFWSQGVGRSDFQELLRISQRAPEEVVDSQGVFGIVQPSPFPDVVYEPRPNLRGKFRGQPFSTNSFGMRGPEVERRKGPGVLRIAGVGDSHMFGWGVAQDEAYLALLERRLNDAGVRAEVLNFSAPGYNAAIEATVYDRKARHFSPDLVVIHFIGNDLNLPHHVQPPRTFAPSDWYLLELARSAFADKGLDGELELLPHALRKLPDDERAAARGRYAYMLGDEGYRRAMERLAAETAADGVPVVVLALGRRPLVAEEAQRHGFTVLDASGVFMEFLEEVTGSTSRARWKELFRIPGDGHPTALAHRGYAEVLYRELARRGLAPAG